MIPTGSLTTRATLELPTGGDAGGGTTWSDPVPFRCTVRRTRTTRRTSTGRVPETTVELQTRPGTGLRPGARVTLPDGSPLLVTDVTDVPGPTGRPWSTVAKAA